MVGKGEEQTSGDCLSWSPILNVMVVSGYLTVFHHSICYADHNVRGGNGGVLEISPRKSTFSLGRLVN